MFLLITAAAIIGGFTILGLATLLMESAEDEVDRAIARRYGQQ